MAFFDFLVFLEALLAFELATRLRGNGSSLPEGDADVAFPFVSSLALPFFSLEDRSFFCFAFLSFLDDRDRPDSELEALRPMAWATHTASSF